MINDTIEIQEGQVFLMKCPKCGTELEEGHLYCEKCGEEIHIVPDFEPEIEYSMHETLSGIVEDVLAEVPKESDSRKGKRAGKRKGILLAAVAVACVLIIIGIVWIVNAVSRYRYNSSGYQISKAEACIAAGDVEKAVQYYERAVELEPEEVSLRFSLAELYNMLGREQAYTDCLAAVLISGYATEDETESAYKKMIAFYRGKEDYASINTLLINTNNEEIRTAYQEYMAVPPEFSYQEGTYTTVVPLKLTSSIQGTIYYTLDGTIPDENSEIYTMPIFLETGQYEISALFVNEYGIQSEVVAKTYIIDIIKPPAPEVDNYSGDYTTPTLITVQVPMDCTVYYTMDGTIPTEQSAMYTGPIPMPLERSTFKFICYNEEGVAGECTTRQFDLQLQTDFMVDMALARLMEIMMANGKILDGEGTPAGSLNGRYLYVFQYALSIPSQGDFYVIYEMYEDSAGVQNRTGTNYAVNVYTQEYFTLSRDASGSYVLEALEEMPEGEGTPES